MLCLTHISTGGKYPQYTKHFLAYMVTIATGYKHFKGLCWAAYDAAYCCKAARMKSLLWGNVDQYHYMVWLTNQAQGPSCANCLSCKHTMDTCPNLPIPLLGQLLPSQQHMQTSWNHSQQRPGHMHIKQTHYPCGLYNTAGGPHCASMPASITIPYPTPANNAVEVILHPHAFASLESARKASTGNHKVYEAISQLSSSS